MNSEKYNRAETDLDRMLSAFFKSELPDPFPKLKLPLSTVRAELPMPTAPVSRRTISNSRFSLAVSVALLLGGCWFLSSHIGTAPERPKAGNGDGSAKLPKEIRKAQDNLNKTNHLP